MFAGCGAGGEAWAMGGHVGGKRSDAGVPTVSTRARAVGGQGRPVRRQRRPADVVFPCGQPACGLIASGKQIKANQTVTHPNPSQVNELETKRKQFKSKSMESTPPQSTLMPIQARQCQIKHISAQSNRSQCQFKSIDCKFKDT